MSNTLNLKNVEEIGLSLLKQENNNSEFLNNDFKYYIKDISSRTFESFKANHENLNIDSLKELIILYIEENTRERLDKLKHFLINHVISKHSEYNNNSNECDTLYDSLWNTITDNFKINIDIEKSLVNIISKLSYDDKRKLAMRGNDEALDVLVCDKDELVRKTVARQGRDDDLYILVNDKYSCVREEVAKYGREEDLDILVNDADWYIRKLVAEHGRTEDLDILVHDEDMYVRTTVAMIGRDEDLDVLVNDEEPFVLNEVIRHQRPQDIKRIQERIDNNEIYNNKNNDDILIQKLKEYINNLTNKENQLRK